LFGNDFRGAAVLCQLLGELEAEAKRESAESDNATQNRKYAHLTRLYLFRHSILRSVSEQVK